jgi:hypothetical protein
MTKKGKHHIRQQTNQEGKTTKKMQVNFATPKQKNSLEWQYMLQKVFPANQTHENKNTKPRANINPQTTSREHDNHPKPLSQQSMKNPFCSQVIKPLQTNAAPKLNAYPRTHTTRPPTKSLNGHRLWCNATNAKDHPNCCT